MFLDQLLGVNPASVMSGVKACALIRLMKQGANRPGGQTDMQIEIKSLTYQDGGFPLLQMLNKRVFYRSSIYSRPTGQLTCFKAHALIVRIVKMLP